MNMVMNIWATHNAKKLLSVCGSNSFSEAILLHGTSMLDRKYRTLSMVTVSPFYFFFIWRTTGVIFNVMFLAICTLK